MIVRNENYIEKLRTQKETIAYHLYISEYFCYK